MSVKTGTPDPEVIAGTQDADLITAFAGDDTLYGQGGNDTLYGGQGDDSILGDFGNDLIFGESGNDKLQSGGDSDQLYGGEGNDWIIVNDINYDGESTGYGGTGDDLLAVFGTSHGFVYGGDGIDQLMLLTVGNDALFVDLASQTLDGQGSFPGVTFAGIERLNLLTNAGDDTAYGGAYEDRLLMGAGRNQVDAKGGDDYVGYITRGASTLEGGDGTDTLAVSGGTSSLYFIFDRDDEAIDDGQGSVITGFERYEATGSRYADVVGFDVGNDLFYGWGGADSAFGHDGNDTLYGQNGADSLIGGAGADLLFGGAGNDTLIGDAGADLLAGGMGDDLLDGGEGDDRLRFWMGHDTATGGAGHDRFLFTLATHGLATITDFESGVDQLRFTAAYLPGGPAKGALDPALLAYDTATGSAAQFVLTYDASNDSSTLVWDPNGADPAGEVDTYAIFQGHVALTAADILIL